jgi:octaprenyl-diphosphate synthase
MAHSSPEVRARLRDIVEAGDATAMPDVLAAIGQTGGIGYSRQRAEHYARKAGHALDGLPESEWLAALRGLAHYALARNH